MSYHPEYQKWLDMVGEEREKERTAIWDALLTDARMPWKGLGEKSAATSNIESLSHAKDVVLNLSAEDQKELYKFMHESLGMRIY